MPFSSRLWFFFFFFFFQISSHPWNLGRQLSFEATVEPTIAAKYLERASFRLAKPKEEEEHTNPFQVPFLRV
jgi:uroporphyrinogen-III decarboxylase